MNRSKLASVMVVAAMLLAGCGNDENAPAPSFRQASSVDGYGTPTVTGEPLPVLSPDLGPDLDLARGLPAPTVAAVTDTGDAVSTDTGSTLTVVAFVDHGCGTCRDEINDLAGWDTPQLVDADVNVVVVATGTDPTADNFPPQRWLEQSGVDWPVIYDDGNNTAAAAFGINVNPAFVLLDADNVVVGRIVATLNGADNVIELARMLNNP